MGGEHKETVRAQQAYADYVAIGPDRSLAKLLDLYRSRTEGAPTRHMTTLKEWSGWFGWQRRITAMMQSAADEATRAAEEAQRQYIRDILETGFGTQHERVRAMKALAEHFQDELTSLDKKKNRLWVREPKGLGSGENFEVVTVERFNQHEVEQFRGLLDDIAKEVGGRVRRTEVTGKDGGPLRVVSTAEELDDDQLAAIATRQHLALASGNGVAETA